MPRLFEPLKPSEVGLAKHIRSTVQAYTGMALVVKPELVGFTDQEILDLTELK